MVPPACHELYFSDDDEVVSARVEPAECAVDADCTLMPAAITCCGECGPVPPFESVTRQELDALLLENETACATRAGLCEPPACAALPEGCAARAICRTGRCVTVELGCGVRDGEP
jgi:hypothetical protein